MSWMPALAYRLILVWWACSSAWLAFSDNVWEMTMFPVNKNIRRCYEDCAGDTMSLWESKEVKGSWIENGLRLWGYWYLSDLAVLSYSACLMYSGCRVQQCQEPILKLFGKSNIIENRGGQSIAKENRLTATDCGLLASSTAYVENTKDVFFGAYLCS